MTVDRDVTTDDAAERPAPDPPPRPAPVTRATVVAYAAVAVGLVGWFLFGWLVLRQGFVSSVGEAVGTAFGLLLVVSVVGMVRRSRRDPPTRDRPTRERSSRDLPTRDRSLPD